MADEEPKLPKHHYIPVFYLREWTRPDGRLTEFSRPTGKEVIPRRTSPKGTGYVRGLYRLDDVSEHAAERFERVFFRQVDNRAKDALDMHLGRRPLQWTQRNRSDWSRFVMGMLFRNPERIAATRAFVEEIALDNYDMGEAEYNAEKKEGDPDFWDVLLRQVKFNTVEWTATMVDNLNIGKHLNQMRWFVRDVSSCGLTLFTSDRPILMTNGLAGDKAHLVMPISPTKAFVACNTEDTEQYLRNAAAMDFARGTNRNILRYAQKYAWHTNDDLIHRANEHLSVEADISEEFFRAQPRRALAKLKDPVV
jgi:hypothetical protein